MDTFEIILGIDYGKTTPARWGLLPSVVSELQNREFFVKVSPASVKISEGRGIKRIERKERW